MAGISPFEHLENLTSRKIQWGQLSEEDKKSYPPFAINRYLSMSNFFIDIALDLNINANITPEAHYNSLFAILPKRKVYIKYISKPKKKSEYTLEELRCIGKYLKIGTVDVDALLESAPKEKFIEILTKHGLRKK